MNTLYIVIPCYNEEEALPVTMRAVYDKLRSLIDMQRVSRESRILLIDDGSRDKSWEIIEKLAASVPEFIGLKLSRNRGTQNALAAGYDYARGKCGCAVSTDADLQDDLGAIDRMLDEYEAGAEIVYGVRSRRATDTFGKRKTAELFYKLMKSLGSEAPYNHSDYRLLGARALELLHEYTERDMFVRDVLPLIGLKSAIVSYERQERALGESKYNFRKLARLALDGVYSAGLKPLRILMITGVVMIAFAAALGIVAVIYRVASSLTGLSWALIIATVWFVGGMLMCAVSVAGEYAARAFLEAKQRPRYHIETETGAMAAVYKKPTEVRRFTPLEDDENEPEPEPDDDEAAPETFEELMEDEKEAQAYEDETAEDEPPAAEYDEYEETTITDDFE